MSRNVLNRFEPAIKAPLETAPSMLTSPDLLDQLVLVSALRADQPDKEFFAWATDRIAEIRAELLTRFLG